VIAEVYPCIRLPRRFSFFDYQIPEGISIKAGDLVRVPFRGREIFAVVKKLKTTSDQKLSSILSVSESLWCEQEDIERFEVIARALAQSPSSLINVFFEPTDHASPALLPKGKPLSIKKDDVELIKSILEDEPEAASADREIGVILAHALRKKTKGQLLILLAREREGEQLSKVFSGDGKTALLHGKTPLWERARIHTAWRAGKLDTLIATKNGALLPARKIETILVLDAASEDHVSSRRNPRFDAREAAKLLARQHGAQILFLDSLPRFEEITPSMELFSRNPEEHAGSEALTLLSLKDRLEYSGDPFLTETLLESTKTALQSGKKVLLFLNRKGVAKRLQCGDCGHLPLCGTCGSLPVVRLDDLICERCLTEMWIPKVCPACGHDKMKLRGIGGAKIASILKEKFPNYSVGRIEKGAVEHEDADVVIVTEYFFSWKTDLFEEKRFGLIADLCADIHVNMGGFRGAENTARKIERLRAYALRQKAACIIQTYLPDLIRPMFDLHHFVKTELKLREEYNLPPYATRAILEGAKTEDLPEELKPLFKPRGDTLEYRFPSGHRPPATDKLLLLSDKIKLILDGPYGNHESPPRTK
jgi:primosomal protein N'